MGKSIKERGLCWRRWPPTLITGQATPRRSGGKYDVNVVTLLASKVDALAQRLDKMGTSSTPGSSVTAAGIYMVCETCGVQGHTSAECFNGPFSIEHANTVHNFHPTPQNNSIPNA